jgi:hypothetical protein
LPQPPNDTEKYVYAKRNLWVLTLFSLVSFVCLAISQFRLSQASPWFWAYVPFLAFTVVYYLISLRELATGTSNCGRNESPIDMCRTFAAHVELSTPEELLLSYYDPGPMHLSMVAVPW